MTGKIPRLAPSSVGYGARGFVTHSDIMLNGLNVNIILVLKERNCEMVLCFGTIRTRLMFC